MRTVPIGVFNQVQSNLTKTSCKPKNYVAPVSFQKGKECKNFLGFMFGSIATVWGALKSTAITGEFNINTVLIYGTVGTLLGIALGQKIDNDVNNGGFGKTA